MRRPSRLSGFTLIEVAVVMLIIVIILGVISVNLLPDKETPVRNEAQRLALLLQTARQESILQGRILAVTLDRGGYRFLILNDRREFVPAEDDRLFRPRSLPADIAIVSVNIEGAPESENPRLLLLPTGELSPFTVTIRLGEIRWQVQGTPAGKISAQSAPLGEPA